jgi:hypothetical protein
MGSPDAYPSPGVFAGPAWLRSQPQPNNNRNRVSHFANKFVMVPPLPTKIEKVTPDLLRKVLRLCRRQSPPPKSSRPTDVKSASSCFYMPADLSPTESCWLNRKIRRNFYRLKRRGWSPTPSFLTDLSPHFRICMFRKLKTIPQCKLYLAAITATENSAANSAYRKDSNPHIFSFWHKVDG